MYESEVMINTHRQTEGYLSNRKRTKYQSCDRSLTMSQRRGPTQYLYLAESVNLGAEV